MRFNLPSDGQYYITVGGMQGVKEVDFDIFTRGAIELEKSIASGSIGSPGDAAGALTVGAVHWDENTIASYSSQGPTDDGRVKPEISAPAGVTSRSYGRLGSAFYGTSASAPFVAGAAALVLSANPNMKPDEVRDFLLQHAKDMGDPGLDNTFGYGLLDLGTGPNAAATGTPEQPTSVPPDARGHRDRAASYRGRAYGTGPYGSPCCAHSQTAAYGRAHTPQHNDELRGRNSMDGGAGREHGGREPDCRPDLADSRQAKEV